MVTIVATEVVENNRDNVGWVLFVVVESLILECQVALAVCNSSVLPSKMVVVTHRSFSSKWLVANEAIGGLLVSLNIFSSHDHWLLNTENVADLALFVIKSLQESVNHVFSSIDDWRLRVLWISADNHVAKTRRDMPLVHCCVPMLWFIDLGCICLKVSIDDEWHRKLSLSVLETDFFLLWLMGKLDGLGLLFVAQFNMLIKSFFECKSVQTVETVVSRGFVLRSIVHETTKVLDQAIVSILSFTNKQEIDVSIWLDVPRLV